MRKRTERRLETIVGAAVTVFSRTGYAAAQVADIARVAGVSVGTVYLYAASKEALFHAALQYAGGKPAGEDALPLRFMDWSATRGLLGELSLRVARWPRLDAALASRSRPGKSALNAVAAELFDLIAGNRRLLRLVDACVGDIDALQGLYEIDIKRRYLLAMEQFVGRLAAPADVNRPVLARAIVELTAWMAMHRHHDSRPIAATDEAIRAETLRQIAAMLGSVGA